LIEEIAVYKDLLEAEGTVKEFLRAKNGLDTVMSSTLKFVLKILRNREKWINLMMMRREQGGLGMRSKFR
jgi:hypothetical protein